MLTENKEVTVWSQGKSKYLLLKISQYICISRQYGGFHENIRIQQHREKRTILFLYFLVLKKIIQPQLHLSCNGNKNPHTVLCIYYPLAIGPLDQDMYISWTFVAFSIFSIIPICTVYNFNAFMIWNLRTYESSQTRF